VFHITNGVTVSISGLMIVNGQADERGGGILNDHSTLTVSNCTIYNNNVGYDLGGGSCNDGSFGSANEINNSTDIRGGGIYNNSVSWQRDPYDQQQHHQRQRGRQRRWRDLQRR
jgi:hypothetical protein